MAPRTQGSARKISPTRVSTELLAGGFLRHTRPGSSQVTHRSHTVMVMVDKVVTSLLRLLPEG